VATPLEERLERLEERLGKVEAALREQRGRFLGVTLEEAKARLHTPVEYGEETRRLLQEVVGSFEGPEDLSQNFREYLRGERR
jgi:hypothetical protein